MHARRIYAVLILFLSTGVLLWIWWRVTGDFRPLDIHLRVAGAAFFVGLAGWEAYLAYNAMTSFQPHEPLHRTWMLIMVSALCRMSGWTIRHATAYRYPVVGDVIAGPLAMVLLSCGLLRVQHVYRELGYGRKLSVVEYGGLLGTAAYVVFTANIVLQEIMAGTKQVDVLAALSWTTDPLLCLLLLQAMILRRSVLRMGGGLIAHVWTAYIAAILLTTLGDLSQWLVAYQIITWPLTALTWFIWYPAAAAYALGAAYQVEAIQRAEGPLAVQGDVS